MDEAMLERTKLLRHDDINGDRIVSSLLKSSSNVWNKTQLDFYDSMEVSLMDKKLCCTQLFELIKLNSNNENFDPFDDRRMMYDNVQAIASDFDFEKTCEIAAFNGHISCLMFARETGCPWGVSTTASAATVGSLDCLTYAHENGCPWDESTTTFAAVSGRLNFLRYAIENDCPREFLICAEAAKHGHLDCLQYLHELGVPWNGWTCIIAAYRGQLECLKYAHQNGCAWDEWTCCASAAGGFVECLTYAHQNGCRWNELTFCGIMYSQNKQCLQYALFNGCPSATLRCAEGTGDGRLDCKLKSAPHHRCLWKRKKVELSFHFNIALSQDDEAMMRIRRLFDL